MSTRDQIVSAAAELRKLIDRIEQEALGALAKPDTERLAAFDAHRRVIDSTLMVLRRTVVRRVEREQSRTEPDEIESSADSTAPHAVLQKDQLLQKEKERSVEQKLDTLRPPPGRPTTRPTK